MKNQGTSIFFFLSAVFFLFSLNSVSSQQFENGNFLNKLFNPNEINTNVLSYEMGNKVQKRINSDKVIQNINSHLRKIARLKAQGVSNSEIYNKVIFAKIAVGTGSISGTVYESDGVTPIQEFCDITVFNEYGRYMGFGYTANFKNGEYSIDELPDGKYYVTASADGYANEIYDNVSNWQNAVLVDVVDEQETGSINFNLKKYQGAVSGKVTDASGNPISFCMVVAEKENGPFALRTESNQNGDYLLSGLQTGNYRIQAEYNNDDKNLASEWYNNVYNSKEATLVSVVEPNTTTNINFVLENGGAIKGKVLDPNGAAVYSYEAYITAYDAERNSLTSTETDENGEFLLTGLSPGIFKLSVSYIGMKNYVEGNYELESWYNGEVDFASATPISVSISDTVKNIIINLHEGGIIKGKVNNYNGLPISYNCEVIAYLENKTQSLYGVQVENGNYMIDKLPTGRYKLFANYFGNTQIVGEEPISEWYDGASNFDDAQFVEVYTPNATENINFTMERGGYISGKVFNDAGQPLSYSGMVEAYSLNNELIKYSEIRNEGMYFITGLPSGEYKLKANYSGEENYISEWYDNAFSFGTADIIAVTAPNQTTNINFTLESAGTSKGTIQGFVTNEEGMRLTEGNHFIQILCFDKNSSEFIGGESNSINGGYQIDISGKDVIVAAVSCYTNWLTRKDNDSLAVTYYGNGKSFNDPNTQAISFGTNSTMTLNDIVLQKASGSISGTMFYKNTEQAISESYIVYVVDEYGYLVTISSYNTFITTPAGKYSACGLRPGNYYLLVMFGDMWNNPEAIWYGGIAETINYATFLSNITIPPGALPVSVTNGETNGIDFGLPLYTEVDDQENLPIDFTLTQNYPNPFNPNTTIKYSIPAKAVMLNSFQHLNNSKIPKQVRDDNINVKLNIYDILGREVATLVKQKQNPGNYEVEWDANNFPSGVYFYQLNTGDYIDTKKMILLR